MFTKIARSAGVPVGFSTPTTVKGLCSCFPRGRRRAWAESLADLHAGLPRRGGPEHRLVVVLRLEIPPLGELVLSVPRYLISSSMSSVGADDAKILVAVAEADGHAVSTPSAAALVQFLVILIGQRLGRLPM